MKNLFTRSVVAVSLAFTFTLPALAADAFPSKPVRILVNTAPGGLTDIMTRLVAQQMAEQLNQTVMVENRAGGDGLIGIRAVKAAPADGYTLLGSAGTVALQMALRPDAGYDLQKDFTGIGFIGRSPFLMVTAPDAPYTTLTDFLAHAKKNPGELTYASAGVGTVPHISAERMLHQAGVKVLHVPYKGNGAAMPDVLAGRVGMIFEAYGSSQGAIKSGQLKVLGVTSSTRTPPLPDVPTIAEQGLPGFSAYTWLSLAAPAGTPKEVVQRLSEAARAAIKSKLVAERLESNGMEAIDMSTDELNKFYATEVEQAKKSATELGLLKVQKEKQ